MKKIIVFLLSALMAAPLASAWGDQGHATIGFIADNHLSAKAKAALDKYLGGLPLAAVASDADKYRGLWLRDFGVEIINPKSFRLASLGVSDTIPTNIEPWTHSLDVDENCNPYHYDLRQGVGGMEGINNCAFYIDKFIKELRENAEGMDPYDRSVKIRMIVHWLGDMHCPMHIHYAVIDNTGGGKKIRLGAEGKETNLHKFWDGGVFGGNFPSMKFSDIARLADNATPEEIAEIVSGDIWDYAKRSAQDCWPSRVFNGKKFIDYEEKVVVVPEWYAATMRPLMMHQLRNGGYRLAAIMNAIFE